jgi:hypothetical protein
MDLRSKDSPYSFWPESLQGRAGPVLYPAVGPHKGKEMMVRGKVASSRNELPQYAFSFLLLLS